MDILSGYGEFGCDRISDAPGPQTAQRQAQARPDEHPGGSGGDPGNRLARKPGGFASMRKTDPRSSVSVERRSGRPPFPASMENAAGALVPGVNRRLMLCQLLVCCSARAHSAFNPAVLNSPRPPGSACRAAGTSLRSFGTPDRRPRERHHDSGQHDDQERRRAPKAERVVPVPVPRLAGEPPPEPHRGTQVSPGPLLRPPEIDAARHQEQEQPVGITG